MSRAVGLYLAHDLDDGLGLGRRRRGPAEQRNTTRPVRCVWECVCACVYVYVGIHIYVF
jgi:hypothetical protein